MQDTSFPRSQAEAKARAHLLRAQAFAAFWRVLVSAARPSRVVTTEKGACGAPQAPCPLV
ncbi:MAG: hypothetical protein ACJASV_000280 [Pseudorhodobacter sp.]|jgi:hypothetical protein